MAELRKGARVRIRMPGVLDPTHQNAPIGVVASMPYQDREEDRPHITDGRVLVQVGQEKRPRPVRAEHLEVL